MLRVLIALALVIGTVQCAAACTPISSGCPHHKHAPPPRCTELIPATPAQPFIVAVQFLTEAIKTSFSVAAPVLFDLAAVNDESPPGSHLKSPFILRI